MQYLTDTQHEEPQDMRTPTGRKPSEPNVQAVPGTPTVALEMQQAGIKRNAFSFDKTYGQILTQELNGFRHLRERICAEMMEQQEAIMREALRRVGVALADVSPHRLHAECGPSHTVLRLDGAALVRIDTVWQSIDYGSNYPFEDAHIKAGCVIRATYYKEQA
jgi:hypothetical protein